MRRGRAARLIARDNGSPRGDLSLDAAVAGVRAGRAPTFAVWCAPDILAIDDDCKGKPGALDRAIQQVLDADGEPVVMASGRKEGGRHLLTRGLPPAIAREIARSAKADGLDVRSFGDGTGEGSGPIRPPFAPHRLGLPVRLLEPATVEEALAAMRPRNDRAKALLGRLSGAMRTLLDTGDNGRYYKSDSERLFAIATELARLGATEADAPGLIPLLDGPGAASLRKKHRGPEYLAGRIRKALAFLQQGHEPPRGTRPLDPEVTKLDAIDRAIHGTCWSGRSGARDLAVAVTLLSLARCLGSTSFGVASRWLAERIGCSHVAASSALQRLIKLGWIRMIARHTARHAARFELLIPKCMNLSSQGAGAGGRDRLESLMHPAEDVWRWGGAGPGARVAWLVLDEVPKATREVAVLCGRTDSAGLGTTRARLKRLESFGLAARLGGGWVRGPATLAEAVRGTRAEGAGERQRRRHAEERAAQAAWLRDLDAAGARARVLRVPMRIFDPIRYAPKSMRWAVRALPT